MHHNLFWFISLSIRSNATRNCAKHKVNRKFYYSMIAFHIVFAENKWQYTLGTYSIKELNTAFGLCVAKYPSFLLVITCSVKNWHILVSSATAGISGEESKHDIPFLPSEKTDSSILFIHTLLHNPASDNVCARGNAPSMGCLLHSCTYVLLECASSSPLIPIPHPLPSLWEHHVCDKVQCNDFGSLPAKQCARVGGHKENWACIWGRTSF